MKGSELKRMLKKNNCILHHEGKRHEMWYSKTTGKCFPVPRHNAKEVPVGTLQSIMRDAGLE